MSFFEIQFPPKISYGAKGGVRYKTDIQKLYGGAEQRNISHEHGLGRWDISHLNRDKALMDSFIAFFRNMKGKAYGFRFKDHFDYSATNQTIGIGDGVETQFQLVKKYITGLQNVSRIITKPVTGTVKIYKDAVEQTISTHFTVDTTTGIITFLSPPANAVVITADFEFDVPVRFDTDDLELVMDIPNGGGSWIQIPLVEIDI